MVAGCVWGGAGQEKWFRDMTLIVRKTRTYKSSQNSFWQIEASSKTSKAHFFSQFFPAAVTSTGTCFQSVICKPNVV